MHQGNFSANGNLEIPPVLNDQSHPMDDAKSANCRMRDCLHIKSTSYNMNELFRRTKTSCFTVSSG